MRRYVAALALTLAAACGDGAGPPSGEFSATLRGDTLLLHNGTTQPVHYAVSDVDDPDTILWLYCAGPGCPGLDPAADATMLLPDAWFAPYAPLFLHWWHGVPDGQGGFRPDRLRSIELRP
ncbi:MAG: hypothetical protein JSW43_01770 [Gemmatimonadota bacterium]|nr:MAG: hypothetical protein JSW43_01770 [Gemmatimonadota bacterium]